MHCSLEGQVKSVRALDSLAADKCTSRCVVQGRSESFVYVVQSVLARRST